MRVAITGASGFLGSYVLRNLQERDVDIVDVRRNAISGATAHPRTTVVQASLADACGAFEAMGRPELLIHLAWGGLPAYQSTRHVEEELPAQKRFLEACVKDGLTRLTVAGTCFEYGLQDGELEESAPAQPVTQYGIAKQRLHDAIASLTLDGLIDLNWARFFYLFGHGQGPGSLYTQLMNTIDEGRSVFDMSGGEQLRDFLPVTEAARLFVDVALADGGAGVVNICSGKPVSVATLVERWVTDRGARVALNKGHYPYSAYEPMAFWGSRAKLDAIIGGH